jgi:uncharacterized membrane protein YedE/YeeE
MNPILLGLITGVLFGAVLSLSGLSNPRLIIDMLRWRDLRLFKLLVTAITLGIVGVAFLQAVGLAHTSIKPLHVLAILSGGIIFGAGFALSGYCPGTSLAAAAEGRTDALSTVAGGILGAGAYALLYDPLKPVLVEPLTFGSPTVPSVLAVHGLVVAVPVGAASLILIARWWHADRRAAPSRGAAPEPVGDSRDRALVR